LSIFDKYYDKKSEKNENIYIIENKNYLESIQKKKICGKIKFSTFIQENINEEVLKIN
jgi:hypothetical protein